jgi:hypothetical protein
MRDSPRTNLISQTQLLRRLLVPLIGNQQSAQLAIRQSSGVGLSRFAIQHHIKPMPFLYVQKNANEQAVEDNLCRRGVLTLRR